ncbi:MAG TPA: hypothetical protein VFG68_21825 [Fimbriiglobus sp.]|nr:hypothetical protein [Fimbriiglobus sp.]
MFFAQQKGFGGPGGAGAGPPPEFWIILAVVVAVVVAIGLVIQIFYLLTLSRALRRCRPRNRQMEPGQVWLNLIPCFNIVWIFITVTRLADSLRDEFDDRRLRGDGDFGRSLGITYNVLNLLGAIPYLGAIFSIAGLVCFIIYWVKIAGYSRQLFEDSEDRYNSYDDRDDDDDRDRDRRYRDDDDDDRDRYDR